MPRKKSTEIKPSDIRDNEKTGIQKRGGAGFGLGSSLSERAPSPHTYQQYRRMGRNPVIRLVKSVAHYPVLSSPYIITSEDGTPKERRDFIEDMLKNLWPRFMREVISMLDYGWSAFEKVFYVNEDGLVSIKKLKSLMVDTTQVLLDDKGHFAGLEQKDNSKTGKTILGASSSVVFTHEREGDNYYGESIMQAILESGAWDSWNKKRDREVSYMTKIASVIPMIVYPPGVSLDRDGNEVSNVEIAEKLLRHLETAKGVCMPNTILDFLPDITRMVNANPNMGQFRDWQIEFLETKVNHGSEFLESIRHDEILFARAWLVPERTVFEGQFGTKAEASAHGDIAASFSNEVLKNIFDTLNRYIVDPILVANWGESARGTVSYSTSGLDAGTKEYLREVVAKILEEPGNVELALSWLPVAEVLDSVGLPRRDDIDQERDIEMIRERMVGNPIEVEIPDTNTHTDLGQE